MINVALFPEVSGLFQMEKNYFLKQMNVNLNVFKCKTICEKTVNHELFWKKKNNKLVKHSMASTVLCSIWPNGKV